jgi:hypothetical protein
MAKQSSSPMEKSGNPMRLAAMLLDAGGFAAG